MFHRWACAWLVNSGKHCICYEWLMENIHRPSFVLWVRNSSSNYSKYLSGLFVLVWLYRYCAASSLYPLHGRHGDAYARSSVEVLTRRGLLSLREAWFH